MSKYTPGMLCDGCGGAGHIVTTDPDPRKADIDECDQCKGTGIGFVRVIKNCADALSYALSVMPRDDLLYRKVAATERAARAAITKATT